MEELLFNERLEVIRVGEEETFWSLTFKNILFNFYMMKSLVYYITNNIKDESIGKIK